MGLKKDKEVEEFFKKVEKAGLNISRIPSKAKKRFIELANEDFCGDYGMLVKYLLDIHDGIIPTSLDQTERAEAKADEALTQLAELKHDSASEEKKVIKNINGQVMKR